MRLPLIFYRMTRFEYWPGWLFYFPMVPYWLYLSLRMRSLSFFTRTNPGIELGGFFGESKEDILKNIPSIYLPKQFFIQADHYDQATALMVLNGIHFPVVVKPDVGERGVGVAKIHSHESLNIYLKHAQGSLLIQEFMNDPEEFGVFYCKMPGQDRGRITSLTRKQFLAVTGDGNQTVEALLKQSVRARFQLKRLRISNIELLKIIPSEGEKLLVEPIGNHCRGTAFLDGSAYNTEELERLFDRIAAEIPGFYYGRFDVKVPSIADLQEGKGIRIMELNGISSEPGHIYDSSRMSLLKAYKVLREHWRLMAEIARANGHKKNADPGIWQLACLYSRHVIWGKAVRTVSTEEDQE